MFTNNNLISSDNQFLKEIIKEGQSELSMLDKISDNNHIVKRFTTGLGVLYLMFCLFLFFLYFFKKTAGAFVIKIL